MKLYSMAKWVIWMAVSAALAAGTAAGEPRIKVIREADATGDLWKEYSRQKQLHGLVPQGAQIMSLDPGLLRLSESFAEGLVGTDRHLTVRLKRMVGVVVGAALANDYCRTAQGHELQKLGMKEDQLKRLEQDPRSAGLKEREVVPLEFARKITLTPKEIKEQDFADLRWEGLSDEEILELTLVAAYFNYLARVTEALGAEPDAYPAEQQ